jgi:hypothetical protein
MALVILAACSACGGEDATLARIGWQFDYRDPTDATAVAAPRDCGNEPAVNPGPAFRAVDIVRVLLEDAEAQVQGSDQAHRCTLSYGAAKIQIGGLIKRGYNFLLEGKAADGTVLYRYPQTGMSEINLAAYTEQTYTLVPAVGEIHFFATYDGELTCPAGAASIDYSLFREGETTATLSGTWAPACEAGLSRELFIRDIPVVLDGPRESFNVYRLLLAAKDAGGAVTHCRDNPARIVRLGDNSLGGNEDLLPATSCP